MRVNEFLSVLKKQAYYNGQIVHIQQIPAKRAKYGKLQKELPEQLIYALKRNGNSRLYSHQVTAIDELRQDKDIVIVTGTASGKSLGYHIPVLESILENLETRALYLFPTKALAHDQLRSLQTLIEPLSPTPKIGAYDGDTPSNLRQQLRIEANILFTNPDMLHIGILPHHRQWQSFFKNLKYVIIDEAHSYRGVFGVHVSAILKRLNRIAAHYDSHFQYIATSATISNPQKHIENLCGRKPDVIENDGAPKSSRIFVIWNPPKLKDDPSKRRSAVGESAAIFADMTRAKLRNIIFTKSRAMTELIVKYAEISLKRNAPKLMGRIGAYRAGYLIAHRRAIESALLSGKIIGVASTNALELGVDVGGLDAVVSVGYPGSIASFWQQMGRAGRRGGRKRASLAMLVAFDNPLDQYFVRNPQALFDNKYENAIINPDNSYVLRPHLACAALELPLTHKDEKIFGTGFISAMIALENESKVVYQPDADNWMYLGEDKPARSVNIRSMGNKIIDLLDNDNRKLEVMDADIAPTKIYPGAIYLHQGESYRVKKLNLSQGYAQLQAVSVAYYTQSVETNQLQVVQSLKKRKVHRTVAQWGKVRITHRVLGYKKISHVTTRQSKIKRLTLPPRSYDTRALWWDIPRIWEKAVSRRGMDFIGGIHAIENAMTGILPLFAMCDREDIGSYRLKANTENQSEQIFIFDAHPGGVGISEQGFLALEEIWREALASIKDCTCENGCPSCIFDSKVSRQNEKVDKKAAIFILEALLR